MSTLPYFLSREGNSLIYNQENSTFVFYVPANYFNNTSKVNIAVIDGEYVSFIGVCSWAIIDSKGKRSEVRPFTFPTMFLCKPYEIEKVKGLKLDNTDINDASSDDEKDYVLLKFKKGDEIVTSTKVPQLIDNVEIFFKMAIVTAKIPTSIPYDKLWELYFESARLNGFSYNMNIQLFGILIASISRDKNDISRPFCATDMKNMNDYMPVDIKVVPKYISPYTAITSENWDESVRAAILMKDKEDAPLSPLEKVITQ